jgi:hypothetical protein
MDILSDYRDRWSATDGPLQLTDFPIFGTRLQYIRQRMAEWRPVTFGEIFQRRYYDPLTYYAFLFATMIGLIGFVQLVLNVVQVYLAVKSLNGPENK